MTDSLICNEEAQFILQRALASVAARCLLESPAMIQSYVDATMHEYSEEAEALLKKITHGV